MVSVKYFIYGIFMGMFEVVPGISGGTLAVLLNIYDKLINAVSGLLTEFKKNGQFLITIVSGMAVGIYGFSHVLVFLNKNFPAQINFLLVGLIVGIVPMVFKKSIERVFRFRNFVGFLLTFIIMLLISYFSIKQNMQNFLNETSVENYSSLIYINLSPYQFIKFFLVSVLSAFCLMLPGCSGTMIMLVFGIYASVINAIHSLNFLILIPTGLGVLTGLFLGSKIIKFCFLNFEKATYWGILGLVLGSVFTPLATAIQHLLFKCGVIINNNLNTQNLFSNLNFIFISLSSILVLILGIAFSYLFSKKVEER